MANLFKGLDSEEHAMLFNDFLSKSKDKRADAGNDDEDGMPEGYRVLAGKMSLGPAYNDNMMLPAWKTFESSHGGAKRPAPMIRTPMPFRQPLADAIQDLVRYRVEVFDYVTLAKFCGMDSFFLKFGVGYARHQWNDEKGITVTTRFDPKNIFWDYSASSFDKANHVIERHVIPRWQFAQKFGKDKAKDVDAYKDSGVSWPKKEEDRKNNNPLDQIEYFLMWSKEGGYKRVYAFVKGDNKKFGVLNEQDGEPGEKWPIELPDEDWHLTPLAFTPIPGEIDAVSTFFAGKGQHDTYQSINAACVNSNLKCGKGFLFVPDDMANEAELIEQANRTINIVGYLRDEVGSEIDKVIKFIPMPPTPDTLLQARAEAKDNWRNTIGINSSNAVQSAGIETATEAKTLQDSAQNLIAGDQASVERFITEIFRKEIFSDLSRMPRQSVLCVKMPGAEYEPEGEFEDEADKDSDYEQDPNEQYIFDVPYEEAILLEKGPESLSAAGRIAKARQKAGDRAMFKAASQGAVGPQLQQVQQQAMETVPQTPEMQARAARDIPMDAIVKIVNPGVEQFIGPEAAKGWVEDLPARAIKAEIGVSVEPGSSSASGRMQNMNEAMMSFNTLSPVCLQLGLHKQLAALANAVLDKTENPMLAEARFSGQEIDQAVQQQQQAAQQAAQAEAQAKAQASQGPTELNPNDQLKAQSEVAKAQIGHSTAQEKTKQQEIKLQSDVVKGDVARQRDASMSQLAMRGLKP